MAAVRPFPVDPVLSGIAIAYRNPAQSLIADEVMPRIPVGGERFSWVEYPLAEGFTFPDTRVGRRGRVNRVEFTGIERTSAVVDFGLEDSIPISDINEAANMRARNLGNFDPEMTSAEGLTGLIVLDREVRVATVAQDPNNYAATRRLVLAGTDQFSDYANSDPISVIKAGLEGTLIYRPNTMVMGQAVWSKLSSHPVLVNAIRGNLTNKGIITREEFARLFEVQKVLVGESFVNTARRGQAATLNRVWGKSIELLYVDPTARPEQGTITWGFTAQYGTRIAGSWEDRNVGLEGGKVVRTGERVKEEVVAKDAGYLIQNAVA